MAEVSKTYLTDAGLTSAVRAREKGIKIAITRACVSDYLISEMEAQTIKTWTALKGNIVVDTDNYGVDQKMLKISEYTAEDKRKCFVANLTLDASLTGFYMGSVGLYLDDGTLFAVVVLPSLKQKSDTSITFQAFIGQVTEEVININLKEETYATIPAVNTYNDLPSASSATYNLYLVYNFTGDGTSALASKSVQDGNYYWAFSILANQGWGLDFVQVKLDSIDNRSVVGYSDNKWEIIAGDDTNDTVTSYIGSTFADITENSINYDTEVYNKPKIQTTSGNVITIQGTISTSQLELVDKNDIENVDKKSDSTTKIFSTAMIQRILEDVYAQIQSESVGNLSAVSPLVYDKSLYELSILMDSSLNDTSSNPVKNSAIANKFKEYTPTANLAKVALSGSYNDLTDKPKDTLSYTVSLPTNIQDAKSFFYSVEIPNYTLVGNYVLTSTYTQQGYYLQADGLYQETSETNENKKICSWEELQQNWDTTYKNYFETTTTEQEDMLIIYTVTNEGETVTYFAFEQITDKNAYNYSLYVLSDKVNPQTPNVPQFIRVGDSSGGTGGSVEWGKIEGSLASQVDLYDELTGLNTKIQAKQDKLTAGANITIENNVISATGQIASAKWGEITGTIDDQTDLKTKMDTKQDKLIAGENITIENNVISATGGGSGVVKAESVANTYDPTDTYVEGDFVMHNGLQYKCTTDILTPETWNENHWKQFRVDERFNEVTNKTINWTEYSLPFEVNISLFFQFHGTSAYGIIGTATDNKVYFLYSYDTGRTWEYNEVTADFTDFAGVTEVMAQTLYFTSKTQTNKLVYTDTSGASWKTLSLNHDIPSLTNMITAYEEQYIFGTSDSSNLLVRITISDGSVTTSDTSLEGKKEPIIYYKQTEEGETEEIVIIYGDNGFIQTNNNSLSVTVNEYQNTAGETITCKDGVNIVQYTNKRILFNKTGTMFSNEYQSNIYSATFKNTNAFSGFTSDAKIVNIAGTNSYLMYNNNKKCYLFSLKTDGYINSYVKTLKFYDNSSWSLLPSRNKNEILAVKLSNQTKIYTGTFTTEEDPVVSVAEWWSSSISASYTQDSKTVTVTFNLLLNPMTSTLQIETNTLTKIIFNPNETKIIGSITDLEWTSKVSGSKKYFKVTAPCDTFCYLRYEDSGTYYYYYFTLTTSGAIAIVSQNATEATKGTQIRGNMIVVADVSL